MLPRKPEAQRERIIVHFGPGFRIPGTPLGMRVRKGETHFSFDTADDVFRSHGGRPPHENIVLAALGSILVHKPAQAAKLSLPADAVYVCNLSLAETGPGGYQSILRSAKRLLAKGGAVYAVETKGEGIGSMRRNEFGRTASRVGFNAEFLLYRKPGETPTARETALMSRYAGKTTASDFKQSGGYLALLTRT
ncbi:MAG: hypothetical protein AABW54_00235 [Candidatus Micrarchaeota archaeon]